MKEEFDFTIIGAGPMGLYLSCLLSKKGFKIRLIDKAPKAGGHARAIKFNRITTEIYYHFFYKNDHFNFKKWSKLLSYKDFIKWKFVGTEIFAKEKGRLIKINPDNFFDLLFFFKLDTLKIIISTLKIKLFKFNNNEKLNAIQWAKKNYGEKFSSFVWLPLLKGKFGKNYKKISARWLYTRIKRHLSTKDLINNKSYFGYLVKTYNPLINKSLLFLKKRKSKFFNNAKIKNIIFKNKKIFQINLGRKRIIISPNEKVISTVPLFVIKNILPNNKNFSYLSKFRGVGVIVCIFELKKKLSNNYWTSVSINDFPFNVIIQQNRLYAHSNNELVYTSKYIETNSDLYKKNNKDLEQITKKSLVELYPNLEDKDFINFKIFKSISAAPVPTINTVENLPNIKSNIKNFLHAGLEFTYPEDRGVGNSIRVTEKILKELNLKNV